VGGRVRREKRKRKRKGSEERREIQNPPLYLSIPL